jgi:uncharacterized protein involved in type VI secretion and phage assembly
MDMHHLPDQGKDILQEQATQLALEQAQKALTQPAHQPTAKSQYRNTAPPPPPADAVENEPPVEETATAVSAVYEQPVWQILIDGKPIKRLVSFTLSEGFNRHTEFSLRIYHAEIEEPGTYRIDQSKDLPGKTLTAIVGSHLQEDRVEFTGIITKVSLAQSKGLNGDIIISGFSPTILLEGGEHLHSFYQKNLESIAKEVVEPLAGKLEVAIKPRYKEKIPYSTQYKESAFAYLNRMASWFGEWFYYDGKKLCLGKPNNLPKQTLYYGKQIEDLQMNMQLLPMNTIYTSYLSSSDQVLNQYPTQRVDGLNFYADLAVEKSAQLYPKPVKTRPLQRAGDAGTLMHVAGVNQATIAGSTFSITGTCKVPYLTTGTKLTIMMGADQELGEFIVTQVAHHLAVNNRYSSTFTAIGGDSNIIPVAILKTPLAEAQLAVVKKNDDPQGQGRVRVQFQWQEGDNMSDWIRVATPDAGGGGDKVAHNRGFVFIPEVGDLVIVNFRESNVDAPYVASSLHHGKIAGGGGKGNQTKSLTTRSGSTVTLDDDKGSVTVSDPSGNVIVLHGNGTITISAPKCINIQSEQINIIAKKDLHVGAETEMTVSSGGTLTVEVKEETSLTVQEGIKTQAKEIETIVETSVKLQATDVDIAAKGTVDITGADVNVV